MAKKTKEEIISLGLKRFANLHSESSDYRDEALDDVLFTYNIGDAQWPEAERTKRIDKRRPYLVHNKTRKFVAQVANRERDSRMSMKVKPIDDKADPKIADIMTGYLHSIEYNSQAETIYTNAGAQALSGGFGYWRILTEIPDDSFDQEIKIVGIENQFSVYLHPKLDYGFIREAMTVDDFKAKYPDADPVSFDGSGVGEEFELWFEEDKVFIAEYFYKEPVKKTIAQIMVKGDIDGYPEIVELSGNVTSATLEAQGFEVLRTREVQTFVIKWCKMTANDVITGFDDGDVRDWVGDKIPIIEVKGDEVNVAGKIHKRSLIRDAKDPQRMYNYGITALTERVGLTPKAPVYVTPEMIAQHQDMWNDAHEENYLYMLYTPGPNGEKPERNDPPAVDPGVVSMIKLGDGDIQDTTGMFDSSFGEKSNERTGVAIQNRTARSDMGTFHYVDNLRLAVLETGRQLIYIVPKVVDTQRMLRIRDYEGAETLVEVNAVVLGEDGGFEIIHDLSFGKYDVESDVKIWSTRREEAAQGMREAMQYAPDLAPIIAKKYFKYADFPGAGEIEDEINKHMENQQKMAENEMKIKAGAGAPV